MSNPRFGKRPTLLRAAIQLGNDGKAPTEIRLLRAGANETDRGYPILFDEIAATMVMSAYKLDGKERLYADWNHGMLPKDENDKPTREQAASSCSFIPEVRNGELFATAIDWTDDGRTDVESKRYNLFSPAMWDWTDDEGNVRPKRLVNFALVNLAGLRNIEPLLAAMADMTGKETATMTEAQIAAIQARNAELETENKNLRVTSSEVVALGGVLALAGTAGPTERAESVRGLVALRGDVLALTGQDSVAGAKGVMAGWKAKADGYDALAKEKADGESIALGAELDAVITAASKDGKLGFTPAELPIRKEQALKLGGGKPSKDGIAFLQGLAATAPKIITTAADAGTAAGHGTLALTAEETNLCATMGIKPETMLAQKKKIADKRAANAQ